MAMQSINNWSLLLQLCKLEKAVMHTPMWKSVYSCTTEAHWLF